jgi:hypothetical protein
LICGFLHSSLYWVTHPHDTAYSRSPVMSACPPLFGQIE